jgi:hypothetical protein
MAHFITESNDLFTCGNYADTSPESPNLLQLYTCALYAPFQERVVVRKVAVGKMFSAALSVQGEVLQKI